jgi:cyclophilin family peptidyl-prolyl cis-trans isomerase
MNKNYLILIPTIILLLTACTPSTNTIDDTLEGNMDRKALLAPENTQHTNQKKEPTNIKLNEEVDMNQTDSTTNQKETSMNKQWDNPPAMQIDTAKTYTATMTTDQGEITIELYTDKVPNTVNNFIFLAREGFYEGVIFHRTIDGFMIQGGDPTGTGAGGPGYKFADEPFEGEYTAGTLAMANAGPNTNGSQFFIMHKDYPLPPNYTIFGKVTQGMDVVDTIATAPTKPSGEGSTPVNPVKITAIVITEN